MKTIRTVVVMSLPQEKPKEITYEIALGMIGSLFTSIFIFNASKNNLKLAGFCEDAETCYNQMKKWENKTIWVKLSIMLSIISGIVAYLRISQAPLFAIGSGIVCVLSIVGAAKTWEMIQKDYPGKTSLMVGKAWQNQFHQCYKTSFDVVSHFKYLLQKMLKLDESSWDDFAEKGTRKDCVIKALLKEVIEKKLDEHAKEILLAERDGHPKIKKTNRAIMNEIAKIGKHFGFEQDWGENFRRAYQEIQ
jgi:hypothetical protein